MRLPWLAAFCLLIAWSAQARADDGAAADSVRIKSVIERQLAAFARDDADTAFGFASPAIRQRFGTADIFMQMVRSDYRAVYRPRSVSFGAAARSDGMIVQEVDLIGPDGAGVRAFYLMERQDDGSWRINGVGLAPGKQRES
jgi:hypothetical protein